MQLSTRPFQGRGGGLQVLSEHKDQSIVWNIGNYANSPDKQNYDVFEHINSYWATLPQTKQGEIFKAFVDVRQHLSNIVTPDSTGQLANPDTLYQTVGRLMDLHDLNAIEQWLCVHSNILIPGADIIKTEYTEVYGIPGSREQTYLREDYTRLLALMVLLRVMVPVWGEYELMIRHEVGFSFKELYAFNLLTSSQVYHSPAVEKLREYIEYNITSKKTGEMERGNLMATIIGGISTDEIPTLVLAQLMVRKLSIGDLRGIDGNTPIINIIFKYIQTKGQGIDGTNTSFRPKRSEKGSDGDDISILEDVRTKQELPPGALVSLEYAVRDPYEVARRLSPDLSRELLDISLCQRRMKILLRSPILQPQITLLKWVMRSVIPPPAADYLKSTTIVSLYCVAEAVLWHRGHKTLAALMTASAFEEKDVFMVSKEGQTTQIGKEIIEKINKLYPYLRRPGGKQNDGLSKNKPVNHAISAIDQLAEMFISTSWRTNLDKAYLKELNIPDGKFLIPADIKVVIANLVLELGSGEL